MTGDQFSHGFPFPEGRGGLKSLMLKWMCSRCCMVHECNSPSGSCPGSPAWLQHVSAALPCFEVATCAQHISFPKKALIFGMEYCDPAMVRTSSVSTILSRSTIEPMSSIDTVDVEPTGRLRLSIPVPVVVLPLLVPSAGGSFGAPGVSIEKGGSRVARCCTKICDAT